MPAYRYATLVWQDAGGYYTAIPVEAEDESWAGYGTTASHALDQLRDYLRWLHRRRRLSREPDLRDAQLTTFKVSVRPEYAAGERIFPCGEVVLPVTCVSGKTGTGLLIGALPLLGVRFYYHEPEELKGLVVRYAQQHFRAMTPGQVWPLPAAAADAPGRSRFEPSSGRPADPDRGRVLADPGPGRGTAGRAGRAQAVRRRPGNVPSWSTR